MSKTYARVNDKHLAHFVIIKLCKEYICREIFTKILNKQPELVVTAALKLYNLKRALENTQFIRAYRCNSSSSSSAASRVCGF